MYKVIIHPNNLKFIEFYNRDNFHVILSNYGASIYEIGSVDKRGVTETVTLSPIMIKYYNNPKFYGLTVGRVAGRLKDARFKIRDIPYRIQPNDGVNLLHSGFNTLAHKIFDYNIDDYDDKTVVTYSIHVKDMEDSFPGDLDLRVVYTLYKDEDTLNVRYLAMSSKDTVLNITNHSYFNLSGNLSRTVEDEYLSINKEKVGLMDEDLILERFIDVPKEFDFRTPKRIDTHLKDKEIRELVTHGYDHIFSGADPLKVTLYDKTSGRFLEITSSYKDVVIYTNNTKSDSVLLNQVFDKEYLGIAIEPGRYHKVLEKDGYLIKANTLYNHEINYRFSVKGE